jgi:hypothetical protein
MRNPVCTLLLERTDIDRAGLYAPAAGDIVRSDD